jgi:DNA-binding CsgD family transcriptional regulator/tetratricopeptide (TPR) repeat protein
VINGGPFYASIMAGTFVGRRAELEVLIDTSSRANAGGPVAAFVVGDPGVGKSRLVEEASRRIDVPYRFHVVGYEPEREVPFAATAGLLRALAESPGDGARLEAILFDPASRTTPLESVRIFEAAHRAARPLEPALLTIDDLQWVDERSLALCHYLVRAARDREQRLTVFAAARPAGRGREFLEWLEQALSPERVTSLELDGLPREDAVELVRGVAPALDDSAAAALWERARGSPFWLEALARTAGIDPVAARLLPARLRGAGADSASLLAVLALAGRPLSVEDAAAVTGWPHQRVELATAELVDRGVVLDARMSLRLSHDLIREAAACDLPEQTRRRLQRRIAEWLEDQAGDDVRLLREALEHRRAGGLPTLELATRLAGSSSRTLLGDKGLDLLARIADEAEGRDDDVLALHADVAMLASELGRHEEARERWLLIADRRTDALERALALLWASKAAYQLGRAEQAIDYIDRARQTGAADDELLSLDLDGQQAAVHLWLEQRVGTGRSLANDVGQRARSLATRAGGVDGLDRRARRAYVDALRVEHEWAMMDHEPQAMLRTAEDWAAATRAFDEESHLTACVRSGVSLAFMMRIREAEERVRRVWTESRRRVLPRVMLDAGYWLGRFLLEQGQLSEAEEVAREVDDLARRVGDVPRGRNRVLRLTRNVDMHRGEIVEALRRFERAATEEPNSHHQIGLYQDLALWLARMGGEEKRREVVARLDAARRNADAVGCKHCSAELLLMSAEALTRVGSTAEARAALTEWDALELRPRPQERFLRRRIQALLEVQGGDIDSGVADLEAAQAEAEPLLLVVEGLWTRLDVAAVVAPIDRGRAVETLRAAADLAAEIGSRTQQGLAEQRLRALGVRTWRRGPASRKGDPLSSLTEREREVARLAATGERNIDIARTLFLSPKTVERHVTNALRKLGAKNRTELAAVLADEGRDRQSEGFPR